MGVGLAPIVLPEVLYSPICSVMAATLSPLVSLQQVHCWK